MRAFWPVGEAAQADYETLREAALAGTAVCHPSVRRFQRAGLAGLIVAPAARPIFVASVTGAARPPWSPYADPRVEALAAGYELLVAAWADQDRRVAPLVASSGPEGRG